MLYEDGSINKVELDQGINIIYDQEAIRLVKQIPNWRVNYRRGKFIPQQWYVQVSFDHSHYLKKIK